MKNLLGVKQRGELEAKKKDKYKSVIATDFLLLLLKELLQTEFSLMLLQPLIYSTVVLFLCSKKI
jgi:hypothetical protein